MIGIDPGRAVALLGTVVEHDAMGRRHGERLGMRPAAETIDLGRLLDRVGLAQDEADRRSGEIGHQLVPDVVADIAGRRRGDAGRHQCRAERVDARARSIVGFRDPERVALGRDVAHDARLHDVVRRGDDGADGAVEAHRLCQRTTGVEPRQVGRRRAGRGKAVPVPPGNAVLHEGHRCIRAQQRADVFGEHRQARRFHGHQHRILRPQIGRPVAGADWCHDLAITAQQGEAAGADGVEMRAAHHHRNLVARR